MTEQEILTQGAHLEKVHELLCAIGLTVLSVLPEVAVHCGDDSAMALKMFAADGLKTAVDIIRVQLSGLETQYNATHGEVESLEAALALEAVQPDRPGAGGYL